MSSAARCIRFASFVLRFSLLFFPFPPRQTVEKPGSQATARLVASQNTKGNIGGEICLSVCPFNTRTPRPFLLSFSFLAGGCVWEWGGDQTHAVTPKHLNGNLSLSLSCTLAVPFVVARRACVLGVVLCFWLPR